MKVKLSNYTKVMGTGDILEHVEFGVCMLIFDREDDNLNGNSYPYKLLSMESGEVENGYMSLDSACKDCYLLISNEDLILSSVREEN